jgi:tripartite-type tricarboxylate transporter receptor subunit TctC
MRALLIALLIVVADGANPYGSRGAERVDSYPAHAVKIIVPVPPGTAPDIIARLVGTELSAQWRQPVIIENRPGAAQNLGAELVAKASPDGYTLLVTPQGPLVISQSLFSNLRFDPAAFVPITVLSEQPLVLIASANSPFRTLDDLLRHAKSQPGHVTFASPGVGSSPHLAGVILQRSSGVQLLHVPYKGLGEAMEDVMSGRVQIMFDNLSNAIPHIRNGTVRALAITGAARSRILPHVPALNEAAPGTYPTSWFAMVSPGGTSPAITEKLSRDVVHALHAPNVQSKFQTMLLRTVASSPEETKAFLQRETALWRDVIKTNGIALH